MSMTATQKAEEINGTLKANDFCPTRGVFIAAEDGSNFHLRSAFMLQWEEYWLVFAEHQNPMTFAKDEVTLAVQYAGIAIESVEQYLKRKE